MSPQGERKERNQREGGKEVKEVEREEEKEREVDSALHSVFPKFQISIHSYCHYLPWVVFRVRTLELWGPSPSPTHCPVCTPRRFTVQTAGWRASQASHHLQVPRGPAAQVASQFPEPRGAAVKTIHLGT